MPRFFFDLIRQGVVEVDDEGVEFEDLYSAVEDGKQAIAQMVGEALPGSAAASIMMRVRDGRDHPIVTITGRIAADPYVDYHRRVADISAPK